MKSNVLYTTLLALCIFVTGCAVNSPYNVPKGYMNDGVFCWRMVNSRWTLAGNSNECPEDAPAGYVVDQPASQH